jgi:hypothetical protein
MSITTKLTVASVLALLMAGPAAAQQADWSQAGDYYAPSKTIVQQPTAAQTKKVEQGDYYAAGQTIVQQPTARELKHAEQGDYYAPTDN